MNHRMIIIIINSVVVLTALFCTTPEIRNQICN